MTDLALDLRYLRIALCVAEQGSFRRAALALDLPQSTVSRRVKLLEHRLGFPLFIRDRRGVSLTVAGADFLKDAIVGARQLDRAARLATEIHRGDRGEVRIGILASLGGGFLHDLLRRFRERHHEIRVELWEGTAQEALHALAMGELDVSFVTGEPQVPGCEARMLWRESIYVVLPRTHHLAADGIVTWESLREETFLVSRGGPGSDIQDYLIRRLSKPGFRPRMEVHDLSSTSLLDLVAMAYGVTLTSSSALRSDVYGVVFLPVSGEKDVVPSSAVWSKENANPALRHLLALAESIALGPSLLPAIRFPDASSRF